MTNQRAHQVKAWFHQQPKALSERVTLCQPQQAESAVVMMGF